MHLQKNRRSPEKAYDAPTVPTTKKECNQKGYCSLRVRRDKEGSENFRESGDTQRVKHGLKKNHGSAGGWRKTILRRLKPWNWKGAVTGI